MRCSALAYSVCARAVRLDPRLAPARRGAGGFRRQRDAAQLGVGARAFADLVAARGVAVDGTRFARSEPRQAVGERAQRRRHPAANDDDPDRGGDRRRQAARQRDDHGRLAPGGDGEAEPAGDRRRRDEREQRARGARQPARGGGRAEGGTRKRRATRRPWADCLLAAGEEPSGSLGYAARRAGPHDTAAPGAALSSNSARIVLTVSIGAGKSGLAAVYPRALAASRSPRQSTSTTHGAKAGFYIAGKRE
ncbi:MAG: hypothetical protein ABSG83_10200 [Roseiarcus sp.]